MPDDAVHLRAWRSSDADALLAAFTMTPDLDTQLGGAELTSHAHAAEFIATNLISDGERSRNWAIVHGDVVVGNIGLSSIERRHDTAWAYYWLATSARGRGLATRALAAVAAHAFADGLFRLELGHRVNNPASCRVATRAGFNSEGIERQKLRYGDARHDVELHARLASDPAPAILPLPMITPSTSAGA